MASNSLQIANISEAVTRLLRPYGVGVSDRPSGTLASRQMRIKDRVDLSEQPSIIYRDQCKEYSSECTGQISRKLVARIEENRSGIRNCNVKASPMAAHCVDNGQTFDLAETKILSHANSWMARLFKEAWLSNLINKCIGLPQAYTVLRVAVNSCRWRRIQHNILEKSFVKNYRLLWRRILAMKWKLTNPLTTKSPCSLLLSDTYSLGLQIFLFFSQTVPYVCLLRLLVALFTIAHRLQSTYLHTRLLFSVSFE